MSKIPNSNTAHFIADLKPLKRTANTKHVATELEADEVEMLNALKDLYLTDNSAEVMRKCLRAHHETMVINCSLVTQKMIDEIVATCKVPDYFNYRGV